MGGVDESETEAEAAVRLSKRFSGLKLHQKRYARAARDTREPFGRERDGPYEKTYQVSVSCWLAGRRVRHDETKGGDEATAGGVRGWDGSSICARLACLALMY